ncbi:MAG: preprotein translocase subunit SecE [Actinomycetota bacterium]
MNREMRRMMNQREGSADRLKRPPATAKKQRTSPRQFFKQVRAELGKVAWPTRKEVVTYTVVVLVSVSFFMLIIGGIDWVSLKGVVWLISKGAAGAAGGGK